MTPHATRSCHDPVVTRLFARRAISPPRHRFKCHKCQQMSGDRVTFKLVAASMSYALLLLNVKMSVIIKEERMFWRY